jgi:hypothetical protein
MRKGQLVYTNLEQGATNSFFWSFGEFYVLQGLIRKIGKEWSLQKAPELNMTWHLRMKHLEEARTHLDKVGPEGGPQQTGRPHGGAGRPPPSTTSALPLECSSNTYEDQSKPYVRSVWSYGSWHPLKTIKATPWPPKRGESGSHIFIHQIKSSSQRYYTLETPYSENS